MRIVCYVLTPESAQNGKSARVYTIPVAIHPGYHGVDNQLRAVLARPGPAEIGIALFHRPPTSLTACPSHGGTGSVTPGKPSSGRG